MARIFRSHWCFAISIREPTQSQQQLCLRVGGREVILVTDDQGHIRAFPNQCLHKGETIYSVGEVGHSPRMRCPHHGWTYGLDGRLLAGPGFDLSARRRSPCLPTVPVKILSSFLLLGPGTGGAAAEPAATVAPGDAVAEGGLVRHSHLHAQANWKLVAKVLCERQWTFGFVNLAFLRRRGARLMIRLEPVAPDRTLLVRDRVERGATAGEYAHATDELDAIAEGAEALQDRLLGGDDAVDVRLVEHVKESLLHVAALGGRYLLSDSW